MSTLHDSFLRAKEAEENKEEKWFEEMREIVKQKPPEPKIENGRMVWDQPYECEHC